MPRRAAKWLMVGLGICALVFLTGATVLLTAEGAIRERLGAYYRGSDLGLNAVEINGRVERQLRGFVRFLPAYYVGAALRCLLIMVPARLGGRGPRERKAAALGLAALALADLFLFARGLNPGIDVRHFLRSAPIIERLRAGLGDGRALGLGEELPPNLLMRYGLADARNYDSVELAAGLEALGPLFEAGGARTSRRDVTWARVARARGHLEAADVRAVVGATPPPAGLFDSVERVGDLWLGWWELDRAGGPRIRARAADGRVVVEFEPDRAQHGNIGSVVPIVHEPGWRARQGGRWVGIRSAGPWIWIEAVPGVGDVVLEYRPASIRIGLALGGAAFGLGLVVAVGGVDRKKGPKPLGAISRGRLESVYHRPGGRDEGGRRPPGGRSADGPLQV